MNLRNKIGQWRHAEIWKQRFKLPNWTIKTVIIAYALFGAYAVITTVSDGTQQIINSITNPRITVYANETVTEDIDVTDVEEPITCNDWAKVYAQEYQVNENLLTKIIDAESGNNEKARNPQSTATGCSQWLYGSWESYGKKLWQDEFYSKNIYSAKDNVELLAWTISEYGTSPWDASRAVWSK